MNYYLFSSPPPPPAATAATGNDYSLLYMAAPLLLALLAYVVQAATSHAFPQPPSSAQQAKRARLIRSQLHNSAGSSVPLHYDPQTKLLSIALRVQPHGKWQYPVFDTGSDILLLEDSAALQGRVAAGTDKIYFASSVVSKVRRAEGRWMPPVLFEEGYSQRPSFIHWTADCEAAEPQVAGFGRDNALSVSSFSLDFASNSGTGVLANLHIPAKPYSKGHRYASKVYRQLYRQHAMIQVTDFKGMQRCPAFKMGSVTYLIDTGSNGNVVAREDFFADGEVSSYITLPLHPDRTFAEEDDECSAFMKVNRIVRLGLPQLESCRLTVNYATQTLSLEPLRSGMDL